VSAGPPVLSLSGIEVGYVGGFTVSVPALDVPEGEVLAVIGPNGSGKSTLLRVLGLLQSPSRGTVCFRGQPVSVDTGLAVRRRMAMVFQQPLLANISVEANVALGLAFRRVSAADRRLRGQRWLERFGVGALGPRPARTLSGGEAQRVALARALVLEPEVLLLDEPFAALDAPTRTELVPELATVLRSERVTTVLVTHDRAEAQALADRVAVVIGGHLHQVDETARVFQAPVSEEVARFVGVETIVTGEVMASDGGVVLVGVAGNKLEVAGSARPGQRVRLGIRPEDVTLIQPQRSAALSSARNHLSGRVVRVTPGSPARVLVDVGFLLAAAVTTRSVAELGLGPGVPVTATFKASATHILGH
jgi:tungstate transport system ATP-binding protein